MAAPQEEATSRQVLDQLLDQHDAASYQLPPLSPGSELFGPIKKLMDRIGEVIDTFLRRILKDSGGLHISDGVLDVLVMMAWGVLILIVAVVLYQCIKLLLSYSRGLGALSSRPRPPEVPLNTLETELASAEGAGDLARALRIRWRILLRRKVLSPGMTPAELLGFPPVDSPELSRALNAGMFDPLELSDRQRYDDLKSSVRKLEGEPE